MTNVERTGMRDLTISQWHRKVFSDRSAMYDFDLVGMCPLCDGHLYLIEDTQDPSKAVAWTVRSSMRLNCPGYLIVYEKNPDGSLRAMRTRQVHPERRLIGDQVATQVHLSQLRRVHLDLMHGRIQ